MGFVAGLIEEIAMTRLFLIAVLLAFATSANAARIVKDAAGNHIRLTDEPCTSTAGVFASMPDKVRKDFRAGSVYWQGQNYDACWSEIGPGVVFVIDESGDQGTMDKRAFIEEPVA